ncbi:MAG: hypothetical protein JXR95_11125 [Deltaproteobacteria bacterium]|nr:hypothetical protein [Deltaproteobacteria bacterium]
MKKFLPLAIIFILVACAKGGDTDNNFNNTANNSTNSTTNNTTNNCTDSCTSGFSRCQGDMFQICDLVGTCYEWVNDTDCTSILGVCEEVVASQQAQCVVPCQDECTEGYKRCSDNIIETCIMDTDCTIWEETQNCTTSSMNCLEESNSAQCVTTCVDECSSVGEVRCNENTAQSCVLTEGCLVWNEVSNCTTQGKSCEVSGNTVSCVTSDFSIFFSEYLEGSSNNKAVEIYAKGATGYNISVCQINIYFNGNITPNNTISLGSTELNNGDTYVVCHQDFNLGDVCDMKDVKLSFNGNDAVELVCDGIVYDVIGQIGDDPGDSWGSGDTVTLNKTLRRKCSVTAGDAVGSDAFDPVVEWDSELQDTYIGLGTHVLCK